MVEYVVAAVVGFGLWGWTRGRRARYERRRKAFLAHLDTSVDVALHVANHEAQARHQELSPLHLLYGLLQDEAFVSAIGSLGGDAAKIEERVHAALDRRGTETARAAESESVAIGAVLARAVVIARAQGRQVGLADAWICLMRTDATRLLEEAGVDPRALLFVLVHGKVEPEVAVTGGDVRVVLHNDDHTTQEFVVEILRELFDRDEAEARKVMLAVHNEGRGVVGRLSGGVAVAKIAAVRARAKERGYPLWIDVDKG